MTDKVKFLNLVDIGLGQKELRIGFKDTNEVFALRLYVGQSVDELHYWVRGLERNLHGIRK